MADTKEASVCDICGGTGILFSSSYSSDAGAFDSEEPQFFTERPDYRPPTIERCDKCRKYANDDEAMEAIQALWGKHHIAEQKKDPVKASALKMVCDAVDSYMFDENMDEVDRRMDVGGKTWQFKQAFSGDNLLEVACAPGGTRESYRVYTIELLEVRTEDDNDES